MSFQEVQQSSDTANQAAVEASKAGAAFFDEYVNTTREDSSITEDSDAATGEGGGGFFEKEQDGLNDNFSPEFVPDGEGPDDGQPYEPDDDGTDPVEPVEPGHEEPGYDNPGYEDPHEPDCEEPGSEAEDSTGRGGGSSGHNLDRPGEGTREEPGYESSQEPRKGVPGEVQEHTPEQEGTQRNSENQLDREGQRLRESVDDLARPEAQLAAPGEQEIAAMLKAAESGTLDQTAETMFGLALQGGREGLEQLADRLNKHLEESGSEYKASLAHIELPGAGAVFGMFLHKQGENPRDIISDLLSNPNSKYGQRAILGMAIPGGPQAPGYEQQPGRPGTEA